VHLKEDEEVTKKKESNEDKKDEVDVSDVDLDLSKVSSVDQIASKTDANST